jgi:hypothetical protein
LRLGSASDRLPFATRPTPISGVPTHLEGDANADCLLDGEVRTLGRLDRLMISKVPNRTRVWWVRGSPITCGPFGVARAGDSCGSRGLLIGRQAEPRQAPAIKAGINVVGLRRTDADQ